MAVETIDVARRAHDDKWTCETGGKVTGSPLVMDGRMYIGTTKGVFCLSAEDGSVNWEKAITDGSDSSACLDDSVVYIGSDDGNLYAIE